MSLALPSGSSPGPGVAAGSPIAGGTASDSGPSTPSSTESRVTGISPATAIGTCFDLPGTLDVQAKLLPCGRPHSYELVAIETATGSSDHYPPTSYWNGPVLQRCAADLAGYSHQPSAAWPPTLSPASLIPIRDSWATGDRTVSCTALNRPDQAGSVRQLRPYHPRSPIGTATPRH